MASIEILETLSSKYLLALSVSSQLYFFQIFDSSTKLPLKLIKSCFISGIYVKTQQNRIFTGQKDGRIYVYKILDNLEPKLIATTKSHFKCFSANSFDIVSNSVIGISSKKPNSVVYEEIDWLKEGKRLISKFGGSEKDSEPDVNEDGIRFLDGHLGFVKCAKYNISETSLFSAGYDKALIKWRRVSSRKGGPRLRLLNFHF